MLAASGLLLEGLSGCSPAAYPVYKTTAANQKIQLPLSLFQQNALQVVRTKELYNDVAVQQKSDGSYQAVLLQCTHMDNGLTPTGSGFHCNLHGSEFDKDGHVTKGPAEQALKQYRTTIEKDFVIIHI